MKADENTNIGRGKRKVECLDQAINMYIIWKTKPHANKTNLVLSKPANLILLTKDRHLFIRSWLAKQCPSLDPHPCLPSN